MTRRKPDRRALDGQLRARIAARGESVASLADVELVHQLGEAWGCYAPRDLDRACALYEQALELLWQAEGDASLRAMPILASWLDCARARRAGLSGAQQAMCDRSIEVMRRRAEPLVDAAESKILAGESGSEALFAGAYVLLQRLEQESRALRLLHATSPSWDPTTGPR